MVNIKFYLFSVQFDCLNTLSDQLLENVRVSLEPAEGYRILREIACPRLPYNETCSAFCLLEFPEELAASTGEWKRLVPLELC